MKKRIYYYDTDCGGVVYYANYLKYLEEARTEFLEKRGLLLKDLAEQGILFVVARQEIDYKIPAFYGDILDIEARLNSLSAVKMEIECIIRNQKNQIVSIAKTIMVCVDKNIRPKVIPDEVKERLAVEI